MKIFYSRLSILICMLSFVVFSQSPRSYRVSSKLESTLKHERDLLRKLDAQEVPGLPSMFEGTHRTKNPRTNSGSGKSILLSLVGDTIRNYYTHDNQGNILTRLEEVKSNNLWISKTRGTYTYDANGNQLTWLYEIWQNGAWVNSQRGTYTYDSNGNLVTLMYESWQNGAWLNISRSTYTHDAFNNTTTANGYKWLDNNWVPGLNALSFAYNNKQDYESIYSSTATATYQYITGVENDSQEEMDYSLSQNYPNPFNPETVIRYALPFAGNISIIVYNSLGQDIATLVDRYMEAGKHTVTFDASKLTSGVYFYRLSTEKGSISRKMTLLK